MINAMLRASARVGVVVLSAALATTCALAQAPARGTESVKKDAAQPAVPALPEGVSPEEFETLLRERLPFSPSQTRAIREADSRVERASTARVGPAPKPVSSSVRVRLSPGADPIVLRLSPDIPSAVIFMDVTGQPWNVQRIVVGRKGLVDIPEARDVKEGGDLKVASNKFTVVPLAAHVSSSMTIYLEDAPAPIAVLFATNQPEVDLRLDVSVQARGPNAVAPILSRNHSESVPAELTSMVTGITPAAAKPLKVVSSDLPDVQAWVLGSRMYVRARANVLAPPVPKDGKVAAGPDGTKVFELPFAPEVLLMQGGSVGRLRLAGFPVAAGASVASAK